MTTAWWMAQPAAEFLSAIKAYLEQPYLLL